MNAAANPYNPLYGKLRQAMACHHSGTFPQGSFVLATGVIQHNVCYVCLDAGRTKLVSETPRCFEEQQGVAAGHR
jgi:hypothetical protein